MPGLTGAELARGDESSGCAGWDHGGRTVFALFDRRVMTRTLGTGELVDGEKAQDLFSVVVHIDDRNDLDAADTRCVEAGATVAAPAQDRPRWGPTLRTAHLRDPDGRLLELQTY
ncbi:glyoxalase/bleomycin resistance/extradiol dioxygenase family protein [Streptomyces sp. NPDC051320]|uniref:VOC family protein n=1 Tax=Streptomyces sp. NPDC051320 TaxID=3154644 RepID=UPI00341551D9